MSRADIGRTNRPRMVNATNSQRPRFVCPRAKYLFSAEECDRSDPKAMGTLRKISSISQSVTRCFDQFFPMFPSSQSHPSHSDGSSLSTLTVYRRSIPPTSPAAAVLECANASSRSLYGGASCRDWRHGIESANWRSRTPGYNCPSTSGTNNRATHARKDFARDTPGSRAMRARRPLPRTVQALPRCRSIESRSARASS